MSWLAEPQAQCQGKSSYVYMYALPPSRLLSAGFILGFRVRFIPPEPIERLH